MGFFYNVVVLKSIIKSLKGKSNFYSVDHPASLKITQLCLVYEYRVCYWPLSVCPEFQVWDSLPHPGHHL